MSASEIYRQGQARKVATMGVKRTPAMGAVAAAARLRGPYGGQQHAFAHPDRRSRPNEYGPAMSFAEEGAVIGDIEPALDADEQPRI